MLINLSCRRTPHQDSVAYEADLPAQAGPLYHTTELKEEPSIGQRVEKASARHRASSATAVALQLVHPCISHMCKAILQ